MDRRRLRDKLTGSSMRLMVLFANSVLLLILISLFLHSRPILARKSLIDLLFSSAWHPMRGEFGFYPFIIGTLEVTAIAMILSVPICLLGAIYLSEYARSRSRDFARVVVDIMAAIPSVIYGLCGVIVIVPFVRTVGDLLQTPTTGYSLLSGGIILGVMVSPVIISVSIEVLRSIPVEARETALALGVTRWEAIKHVILRTARRGIFSAIVLGFTRAFGETVAVLMVVGNVPQIPHSLFDPAYPLPALLANNYGEMMSIPLYSAALLLPAFLLVLVVSAFNVTAHLALIGIERTLR